MVQAESQAMAKFEDSLGREGFKREGESPPAEGVKPEPPRFAADSPFPAFRMIAAGSSPIEPELAKPTPMMKALPIAVIVVAVLVGLAWWLR
jgi:hypothetical protein